MLTVFSCNNSQVVIFFLFDSPNMASAPGRSRYFIGDVDKSIRGARNL